MIIIIFGIIRALLINVKVREVHFCRRRTTLVSSLYKKFTRPFMKSEIQPYNAIHSMFFKNSFFVFQNLMMLFFELNEYILS